MNKGIFYIIISGLSFLVVNFFVKLFGSGPNNPVLPNLQKIPAHELVLARSIISLVISFVIIFRNNLPLFGVNKRWLIIRGAFGTLALTIFFLSIQNLPFSISATIQYLAPIFTMIFAAFLLNEKILKIQWILVSMAFVGVAVVSLNGYILKDETLNIDFFWIGMGLLSASCSGVAYIAIVKLKSTDHPVSVVSFFPLIAAPAMIVWCCFDFVMPRGIEWLILLLIGIFTQIAQISLTRALHLDHASKIIPFQYLGSIYALLVGFLILDERLNAVIISGVALILIGVTLNSILRSYYDKKYVKHI